MNAPDRDDPAAVPGENGSGRENAPPQLPGGETGRVRPGLKAMHARTLGWIAAVAVAPVIVTLLVVWPLAEHAGQASDTTIQSCRQLHRQAVNLAARLDDAQRSLEEARARKLQAARAAHRLRVEEAVRILAGELTPLLRTIQEDDKRDETLEKMRKVLADAPEILLDAVVLGPDEQVVCFGTDTSPGPVSEKLPDLSKILGSRKESPPLDQPGWHWTGLGRQGHRLAVRIAVPEDNSAAAVAAGKPPAVPASVPIDMLEQFDKSFSKRVWVLTIALLLLALGLGGAAFWWLHRSMLAPLQNVSRGARQILEDPRALDEVTLQAGGMTEDLAASLLRLRTRMQRLEELDARRRAETVAIGAVRDAMESAAAGNLARRVEASPGMPEELAQTFNRLMDAWTERVEAFRRACLQLDSSASRLHELAESLAVVGSEANDGTPSSPVSLGDVLGTQLKALCDSAVELADVMTAAAPPLRSAQERKDDEEAATRLAASLQVLAQRIDEGREAGTHLGDVRQEAEVLFTNLAIAAEARSWTQLEKLVDETRSLSRSMLEASDALTRSLDGIDDTAEEIGSILRHDDRHGAWNERLHKWEEGFEEFRKQRRHLERQIDTVRPAAASLGQDVRQLLEGYTVCRRTLAERRETTRLAGEGARSLGDASRELLRQLDLLETGQPAPAAVTRELARQQRSLDRALRDLASVAAEHGIESLSSDAREILERIREAADQARERIGQGFGPESGDHPAGSGSRA